MSTIDRSQALQSFRGMQNLKVPERTLKVHRINSDKNSFMKTGGYLGQIVPGGLYRILEDNLEQVRQDEVWETPAALPDPHVPRMLVIENGFQEEEEIPGKRKHPNVLGDSVVFRTKKSSYTIPRSRSTAEEFAYYGVYLLSVGSSVEFDTNQVIPYRKMMVGERYVENYLLKEEYGGGFYLEHHSCPHFHQPLNGKSGGWIILGKFTDDKRLVQMSAFHIRRGFAVYMPSDVLHCDAYLTGDYLVAYAVAEEFEVGLFRTDDMQITSMNVWCGLSRQMFGFAKFHPSRTKVQSPRRDASGKKRKERRRKQEPAPAKESEPIIHARRHREQWPHRGVSGKKRKGRTRIRSNCSGQREAKTIIQPSRTKEQEPP